MNPYSKFEKTALWAAIDAAVSELERNSDIALKTERKHVIGYFCQHLTSAKVVSEADSSNLNSF